MNIENQNKVNEQRKKYMDNELTHEQYYTWLAEFIGANEKMLPVSKDRIIKSTDKHLNDIPLILWDNQDYIIRSLAYRKGLSWALSDTVCVLKAIAKNLLK